jgi:hypothetical protein
LWPTGARRAVAGLVLRSHEELAPTWLGEDPEHWPVLRLTVIDPWKELASLWTADTPQWLRTLGTIATTAHVKDDPFGRRAPG